MAFLESSPTAIMELESMELLRLDDSHSSLFFSELWMENPPVLFTRTANQVSSSSEVLELFSNPIAPKISSVLASRIENDTLSSEEDSHTNPDPISAISSYVLLDTDDVVDVVTSSLQLIFVSSEMRSLTGNGDFKAKKAANVSISNFYLFPLIEI